MLKSMKTNKALKKTNGGLSCYVVSQRLKMGGQTGFKPDSINLIEAFSATVIWLSKSDEPIGQKRKSNKQRVKHIGQHYVKTYAYKKGNETFTSIPSK